MTTVYLNKDKSLACDIMETNQFYIRANHENKKNSRRLCDNVKSVARIEDNGKNLTLYLGKLAIAEVSKPEGKVTQKNMLTSFETRLFSQGKNISNLPFERPKKPLAKLTTDLHTHFAGALSPETLIEIATGQGVTYPKWMLTKMGINTKDMEPQENGEYALEDIILDNTNRNKFINSMKIDTSEQETFRKMEDIYVFRGPITKNPHLFMAQVFAIAKDCQRLGVKYIELSLSSVISDVSQLTVLNEKMPQIEKETGVSVRFLAALWRHSDKEWNEDEVDRLKVTGSSPYIAGMDVMGHEINPTMDFYDEIKDLAKYAMENDPTFVIRVHAGENPLFKANVRQVLLAVRQAKKELEEKYGEEFDYPPVRIGHGIYGYDEPASWDEPEETKGISTEQLFREIDPIVEVNKSSNLSLNNINSSDEVPVKRYVENGVRVVLGTDGMGIYSTDPEQEALLAYQGGLSEDEIAAISKTEKLIIKMAKKRFKAHKNYSTEDLKDRLSSCYRDGKPHYTKEVEQERKKETEKLQKYLGEAIKHSGAETNMEKIQEAISGKIPVMITGSSAKHWPMISPENQNKIRIALTVLIQCLDKDKVYLVTGGTNHGVEKEAHIVGNDYNRTHKGKELVILGTLTEEASQKETNSIEKDTITHAMIATVDGRPAKQWFALPDAVLMDIQEKDGVVVAIGGGPIVSDIIQRAHNMSVNMEIMSGVEGASGDKAISLKGNEYEFADAKELITDLIEKYPFAIKREITPQMLDKMVDEAEKTFAEIESMTAEMREEKIEELNESLSKIVDDEENE